MGEVLDQLADSQPELMHNVAIDGDPGEGPRCHVDSVVGARTELVDNGHRFGQPPIFVSWYRDNDVDIEVSDAGPGPDPHL